jgi:hypothetical protein
VDVNFAPYALFRFFTTTGIPVNELPEGEDYEKAIDLLTEALLYPPESDSSEETTG